MLHLHILFKKSWPCEYKTWSIPGLWGHKEQLRRPHPHPGSIRNSTCFCLSVHELRFLIGSIDMTELWAKNQKGTLRLLTSRISSPPLPLNLGWLIKTFLMKNKLYLSSYFLAIPTYYMKKEAFIDIVLPNQKESYIYNHTLYCFLNKEKPLDMNNVRRFSKTR